MQTGFIVFLVKGFERFFDCLDKLGVGDVTVPPLIHLAGNASFCHTCRKSAIVNSLCPKVAKETVAHNLRQSVLLYPDLGVGLLWTHSQMLFQFFRTDCF